MERFVYQGTPSRVVFECGALAQLPEELARLGVRRALILSTPEQRNLADRVKGILGSVPPACVLKRSCMCPSR